MSFRALINKYRRNLIPPVTLVLVVIGLINLYFVFNVTPLSNDECLWIEKKVSEDSVGFFFDVVKFEGVTWNAGIRDGDELLEINDVVINNLITATNTLNKVDAGNFAKYKVARNEQIFETEVRVKKLIQIGGLAAALLGFIWLLVGHVVLTAKSDGLSQILFYRIGALFTLYATFNLIVGNNISNPITQQRWLLILVSFIWAFAVTFVPFIIVHFFWVFPRQNKIIKKRLTTKILYLTPSIIFVLLVIFNIVLLSILNEMPGGWYVMYYVGGLNLMLVIGLLIGLVSLFRSYIKLETPKERNSIFVILISYTIVIAAILYTSTLANVFADTIFNSPEHYFPMILIAILPISFGYSIFKYSLMDVSDVVKNTFLYGAATITVAAIYFFVIYTLGQSISSAIGTEYQGIVAGVIFILFAIIFQSTKDKFQEVITKRFYPEQFVYQKVLLKFSNDVSTIVGLENILDSTHQTFVKSLKLDKFGILLINNEKECFELKRGKGLTVDNICIEHKAGNISKAIKEKEHIKLLPAIEKSEFEKVFLNDYEILLGEGIYTVIPLIIKSKIIGLLLFGLKYSGSQFAGKDLELLCAAANQTAVSIENARLYESEADKMKIDRDLENARKIQQSLLPRIIPKIKGLDISGKMIPAMQVGGDYFDVIKVSDTKLFVVIGDVSGKGLAASFYMSKLQTMMQLYCTGNNSPKEVLIDINKIMYGSIEKNWFITVSIALFDTAKNKITFCRAGHTPLIVVNHEKTAYYKSPGIGIGLESGTVFNSTLKEIELPIEPEKMYAFFSDGVNEAMNEKWDLYGVERLESILANHSSKDAEQILDELLQSLDDFRGNAMQNDDITLVLVKSSDHSG